MTQTAYVPAGVIPACLLPFKRDFAIDELAYRKHLRDVAAVEGISAITVNAHASEVASCTFDEQRAVLDWTMDEIGDRVPIVNGVYADGSLEAARIARMAERSGASCLLVFPPSVLALGALARPQMVLTHYKTIAEATDLPLICFQYPLQSGMGLPVDTLLDLIEAIPSIRAVKDWCNNVMQHETQIRLLQGLSRPVNVLTTHSSWLLSSLVLGCNGLLSGAGSVIPELQVALWRAIQESNLALAREINERIVPIAHAFYADPFVDMHNRMKEALVMLGRLSSAVVRPPLIKLSQSELTRIRDGLVGAGLVSHDRELPRRAML